MVPASYCSLFLSPSLPEKPVTTGCFALTDGIKEHAVPFSIDSLFGENALLGQIMPQSAQDATDFFKVPAPVFLCNEVTSTFSIGHILAKKGYLPAWGAVLASLQTAGKGQYNRRWESPKGNLYVTFRIPDTSIFHTNAAALIIGILLADAFARLGYPLKLKWPNDLLNQNHEKVAGILVENRGGVLLAGVGVNLRSFPDKEQLRKEQAISAGLLESANGTPFLSSPFALWKALVNETIFAYSQAFAPPTVKTLPDLANSFLAWKGEKVTISDANGIKLVGSLMGISFSGGLLLQSSNGEIHEFLSGSLARG